MMPSNKISGKPVSTVVSQLKRSFLIINSTIAVFFIIYLLQAYVLYERSSESDQLVIHTNDVINNIKSADADNQKIESSLNEYLLTRDPAYVEKLNEYVAHIKTDIANLSSLTHDNEEEREGLKELVKLIDQKITLSQGIVAKINSNNGTLVSEPETFQIINESIDRYIESMKQRQNSLLHLRTNNNRYYSKARVVFSLISYILISIFLVIALYKINQNVRKRAIAEQKARINEVKYKTLVENSGLTTLVVNSRGVIKFASKNVYDLAGLRAKDLLDVHILRCMPKAFIDQVSDIMKAVAATGSYNNTFELQIFTSTGINKWISCRVFPVTNDDSEVREWQVIIWDINDDKMLQQEIEEMEAERTMQQKLIQDIIDNIPSVIYIKDLQGRYILVNKQMEEFMGIKAGTIIGSTDRQLIIDKEKYNENKLADERVLKFKSFTTMEEVVQINGKLHYYLVTKFPLFDNLKNVKNICGLATEITDRKESELKLLNAKKEAEKARIAQEAFLANMSHEIRTPMNGIMGMGNLLMGTDLNQEQKEFTENIQESARNLLSIINDILDFSKIKSGKFQFDQSPFKVKQTIMKAIYPLRFKADEKMVKLNIFISDTVPEVLIGDPIRLQQIFINLAGNAIKFTSYGSVDINVSGFGEKDGKIFLQADIKDTGIGIAENKLEYIFESFTQNNLNTSRQYGGTGLGLAIVKQLVELQNGHVFAKSTLGRGSTFSFSIPFQLGQETKMPGNSLHGEYNNVLDGISILVAEDNLINQKVVRNTLQKQGAKVNIVVNGQEAIEEMKQHVYDLILMDLQMPEVDGYKATRYIRNVIKSDIPILAMTADAIKGESEKCFEAGMTGFISKPFEPNDLYQQILSVTREKTHIELTENTHTQDMQQNNVDFTFLYEISDQDPSYIHDVIEIFLETMPEGLEKLKDLILETDDWDAISKQAHFLKSSVSVIKVGNMFEELNRIELLGKQETGRDEIEKLLKTLLASFDQAHPILIEEKEKQKLAK